MQMLNWIYPYIRYVTHCLSMDTSTMSGQILTSLLMRSIIYSVNEQCTALIKVDGVFYSMQYKTHLDHDGGDRSRQHIWVIYPVWFKIQPSHVASQLQYSSCAWGHETQVNTVKNGMLSIVQGHQRSNIKSKCGLWL